MTLVAVVQARLGSTRFPSKCLADLAGEPMLAHVLRRVQAIKGADEVILAIPSCPEDHPLAEAAARLDVRTVTGSHEDVLARVARAARLTRADAVLRVTADCPLFDPGVADQLIAMFRRQAAGVFCYVSNIFPVRTFPDGLDAEIMTAALLYAAESEATDKHDREHVTPWMQRFVRKTGQHRCLSHHPDLSALRWTVDVPVDLELVRAIMAALDDPTDYSMAATWLAAKRAGVGHDA